MVECQAGDNDLAAASGPGLTVFQLDPLPLLHPVTVLGQNAMESDPINLCVPADAVSMVLYPDPDQEALASSYVGSGLGEIVDASNLNALLRVEAPDLMLPKGPEVQLVPGHHSFKIAGASAQVQPFLAIRRGARGASSHYAANLVLVDGCGIDDSNIQAFADAGGLFDQLYAQVGIEVSSVGVGFIHDPSLAVLPDSEEAKLSQATVESSPNLPMLPDAINFYFVRELKSDDAAGTLLGHAMGIPGVPALAKRGGVTLSVDAHRNGPNLDFGALWITAAHEGGHWHGLRHPTERDGAVQDLIADTSECPPSRDVNHDGYVDSVECAGMGSDNLMFWTYDFATPPSKLTPGQGFALASALLMSPQ